MPSRMRDQLDVAHPEGGLTHPYNRVEPHADSPQATERVVVEKEEDADPEAEREAQEETGLRRGTAADWGLPAGGRRHSR